jgi:hypothetical protein
MKKTKPTPSILERASRMARRPLPVSSKDELKMQKTQSKVSERSKWGTILEDLDSFSNDIASYTSTTMTESVVTETSIYTSTSASSATAAAAAAAPLHSDAVERPPLPPSSHTENYAQLPNADTSSEKIHMEEFQVAEAPKDCTSRSWTRQNLLKAFVVIWKALSLQSFTTFPPPILLAASFLMNRYPLPL